MLGKDSRQPYQEFSNEDDDNVERDNQSASFFDDANGNMEDKEPDGNISEDDLKGPPMRISKACVKNFFTVLLIVIYLMLTTVAGFLAYQTISDLLEKIHNPVMSVTYKEVDSFTAPGIAIFPGKAQLLGCKHYLQSYIPPLVNPGKPQEIDCLVKEVMYVGPFSNKTQKALVVRGPTNVRRKEVIFMQFSCNETGHDFSAITYMLFACFSDLTNSTNQTRFMNECEKNSSLSTFSGGFRTWVKMSLVKTSGRNNAVEFRQESSMVKFNDPRPESERNNELFFAVFEWRDPYIQEIKLLVTANAWSSIAILCGVFMALFKAANFAKLTIQWIIKMRKRYLRNKAKEMTPVTDN